MAVGARVDYRSALEQVRLLAGIPDTAWRPEGALVPRPLLVADSSLLAVWGQQQVQVAALELGRQQKTLLPGFGVGVVTNVDPKNRFLPNAYVSLNVPLFRKGHRAETAAARARQLVAADEVAVQRRAAEGRRQQALRQWQLARADLDYWDKTGAPQAAELLRAASLARQAGEATATEYLQAVGQAFGLETNRLEAVRLLNEAVVGLGFWEVP